MVEAALDAYQSAATCAVQVSVTRDGLNKAWLKLMVRC